MNRRRTPAWAAALLSAAAFACGPAGPRPIALGAEECRHCHMTVSDPRFAAELVTRKGKIFVFDDVGCLATFTATGPVPPEQVEGAWVTDLRRPGTLIPAQDAMYLRTDSMRTPMGSHLVAVAREAADSLRSALGGELLDWGAVLAQARAAT
jgi:copper chaperone NosL